MEERRVERHGDKNLQKTSKKDILETKEIESYWEKDKTKCEDKERKKEKKVELQKDIRHYVEEF